MNNHVPQERMETLRRNIGDELFEKLSYEDKVWIIKTEGSINLGHKYDESDMESMFNSMNKYHE